MGKNKLTGDPYIGRTSRNVSKRVKEHAKHKVHPRDLVGVKYLDNLTIDESKILEQALINNNNGIDFFDNLINGMSDKNPLSSQLNTVGEKLVDLFKNLGKWL